MALLPVCAVDSLKCKVVEARKIGISQSFSVWHQASYSALVVKDVSMNGGGSSSLGFDPWSARNTFSESERAIYSYLTVRGNQEKYDSYTACTQTGA